MPALAVLLALSCTTTLEEYYVQTVKIPEGYTHEQKVELSARVLPHPRQMEWFEDEFFGFIHFGPNTFTGREWGTMKATACGRQDIPDIQWLHFHGVTAGEMC
jgi:hypothetical protein